jgi:hypothetical protein
MHAPSFVVYRVRVIQGQGTEAARFELERAGMPHPLVTTQSRRELIACLQALLPAGSDVVPFERVEKSVDRYEDRA